MVNPGKTAFGKKKVVKFEKVSPKKRSLKKKIESPEKKTQNPKIQWKHPSHEICLYRKVY